VIPTYGLMGAAWSRAVIQTFGVAFGSWFLFRRLRFPLPFAGLFRLLLAAGLCWIAARACLWLTTGPLSIALAVVVGIVVYAIAVRALGALPPADAERLRLLCRGFPDHLRRLCDRSLQLLARMTAAAPLRAASLRSLSDGD
jgi:hypothetical protein